MMTSPLATWFRALALPACLILALATGGCGDSHVQHYSPVAPTAPPVADTPAPPHVIPAIPAPRIISPRGIQVSASATGQAQSSWLPVGGGITTYRVELRREGETRVYLDTTVGVSPWTSPVLSEGRWEFRIVANAANADWSSWYLFVVRTGQDEPSRAVAPPTDCERHPYHPEVCR